MINKGKSQIIEFLCRKSENSNKKRFHFLVSAGGLEPPTPPIKSECSTRLYCDCSNILLRNLCS